MEVNVFNENLPKLILSLTGFSEKDKNFRLCRDFARARVRGVDPTYVSTNEVKRRILGISERLEVENLAQYAEKLQKDFKKLTIQENGEDLVDTHKNWKILELLLALSRNPIEGAKRMRREEVVEPIEDPPAPLPVEVPVKSESTNKIDWRNVEDSDLSDWSESGEEEVTNPTNTGGQDNKMFLRYLPGDDPSHHRSETDSESESSSSLSASLSDRVPFSLRHCPIREVIWMFFHPDNCNFYSIENDTVKLREDADLSNIIVFRKFMADFARPMTIVLRLRTFCRRVLNAEDSPPQVYFIYAEALRDLLRPMEEYLLEVEKKITPDTMNEPATLLDFCHTLEPHLQVLKHVIKIHEGVVVEWKYVPRHICSAFLQAKIFHIIQSGLNRVEVNVAASLFACVTQFYLQIIHSWWSFGRISDEQKEFIVKERSADSGVVFRSFQLGGGSEMDQLLENCPILSLLKEHCEKIEERLDAIHAMNRAGSYRMKTTNSLCQDFLDKFMGGLEDFLSDSPEMSRSSSSSREFSELNGGKLLLQLFEKSSSTSPSSHSTVNLMLRNLMDRSKGMLPLERIIKKALNETLNTEIQASDKVMVEIYAKELNLLKHFRVIRQVFLLEDSATMFTFYTRLFDEIESHQDSIHPLSLTLNLQNVLSTKHPESHSNFRLEVASLHNTKSDSVLQVIRQLSLVYKMTPNIARVFDETSMRSYNRLFVFLLSIKWSVWTLESLKFSKSFSAASSYAPLTEKLRNTRRLAIIRFWILYALNNIHCHLMSEALERLGREIEQRIEASQSLQAIITAHSDYLETLLEHCFLKRDGEKILTGINQLFHLVQVIRSEWVAVDRDCDTDEEESFEMESQIGQIEKTYMECHRFLATTLNQEVAINGKTYLSGLVSAFDRNLSY